MTIKQLLRTANVHNLTCPEADRKAVKFCTPYDEPIVFAHFDDIRAYIRQEYELEFAAAILNCVEYEPCGHHVTVYYCDEEGNLTWDNVWFELCPEMEGVQ